jgi:hypothetical protein
MENPFVLMIYNKDFEFQGYLGNPINLAVTPRFNETGTATVEIDLDHRLAPAILAEGSRIVISKDGTFVLSGRIYQKNAEGPAVKGTLKFFVKSDFRTMHQVLGWPLPGSALADQGNGAYDITGNAEAALKTIVQANMVSRLGLPITVAASAGRGATLPAGIDIRFHPLYEKLFPAIEQAGLGVTFEQSGAGIVMDVFEPPVYPFVLSEESGVLQWWSWSASDATATRVISEGNGEATDSVLYAQATDADLETAYNDAIEVHRRGSNGSSSEDTDAERLVNLAADAAEALAENAPKAGFAVRLSETGTFRYGEDNLVVGALVTISVGGVTRTDYLREVTMTYSRDRGVEVTPVVGDIQDNPDRVIASFLARLKKSINDLKASK